MAEVRPAEARPGEAAAEIASVRVVMVVGATQVEGKVARVVAVEINSAKAAGHPRAVRAISPARKIQISKDKINSKPERAVVKAAAERVAAINAAETAIAGAVLEAVAVSRARVHHREILSFPNFDSRK